MRQLRRGVALARRGVRRMQAAMGRVGAALPAWAEHRCDDAAAAIDAGTRSIPAALRPLNAGMTLLLRL